MPVVCVESQVHLLAVLCAALLRLTQHVQLLAQVLVQRHDVVCCPALLAHGWDPAAGGVRYMLMYCRTANDTWLSKGTSRLLLDAPQVAAKSNGQAHAMQILPLQL